MENKKYSIIFILMFSAYILVVIGSRSNFFVVEENDCRMPVNDINFPETDTHFPIKNKNDVNYYLLSDIFNVDRLYFSIGDILIIFSLILVMFSAGILVKYKNVET